MDTIIIISFFIVAGFVVFLSMKLGKYIDWLDKSTNVSGALIGGLLLAAVTSLPELFTSLSAIILVRDNALVLGNVLGSNLFNLATLSIVFIIFMKKFLKTKVQPYGIITLASCLVIYALIIFTMIVPIPLLAHFNVISLAIIGIYVFVILNMPKTEEAEENCDEVIPISVKQIITRTCIAIVGLVVASIYLTLISDNIAEMFGLGTTFVGALFLGLVTSLPEIVSSFTLAKRGNAPAAIAGVLGSMTFNFTILAFCDVIGFGLSSVYVLYSAGSAGLQGILLAVLGGISALLTLTLFTITSKAKHNGGILIKTLSYFMFTLVIVCYIAFLVLPFVLTPLG